MRDVRVESKNEASHGWLDRGRVLDHHRTGSCRSDSGRLRSAVRALFEERLMGAPVSKLLRPIGKWYSDIGFLLVGPLVVASVTCVVIFVGGGGTP